jgi:hypothetical protein
MLGRSTKRCEISGSKVRRLSIETFGRWADRSVDQSRLNAKVLSEPQKTVAGPQMQGVPVALATGVLNIIYLPSAMVSHRCRAAASPGYGGCLACEPLVGHFQMDDIPHTSTDLTTIGTLPRLITKTDVAAIDTGYLISSRMQRKKTNEITESS